MGKLRDILDHTPPYVSRPAYAAAFEFRKRVLGYRVSGEPHLDPEALANFNARLGAATFYVEYGMGGSTIRAARAGVPGISVDSDQYFAKAVSRELKDLSGVRQLLSVDIGWTGPWGKPRFATPNPKRLARWASYVDAPFREKPTKKVDFALVDGRFRVACMLKLVSVAAENGWTPVVLFDDYGDRDRYHVVEDFVAVSRMFGRMAEFKISVASVKKVPNAQDIRAAIDPHA